MLIKATIYFLLYLASFFIAYKLPLTYQYSDLKDYISILLGASSMVFTIMGIWIAFLYPNALQRLIDPNKIETADFSATLNDTKRLEALVASVLQSAFVVIGIMLLTFFKMAFNETVFFSSLKIYTKPMALSLIFLLSLLQLESIFYVIYSNVMFINDLHTKREDRAADADI